MKNLMIVVDTVKDWEAYYPSEHLIEAKNYLFNPAPMETKKLKVINLCKSYKYLSIGYYISLLAEARGHRAIPSVRTLNDLSKKKHYLFDLDDLQQIAESASKKYSQKLDGLKTISFRSYFGNSKDREFKDLARQIFEHYPCPILEIKLVKKIVWRIDSIQPISFIDIDQDEEEFFGKSLEKYSTKIWRLPVAKTKFVFDLAILVNPEEKLPPSNEEALQLFERACFDLNIYTERITKKDYSRINEFDGLFIRETTTIKNHTYAFSNRASNEGLVVIDDPESILKCTNKIFMYNLMAKHHIPQIPSYFVSDVNESTLDKLEQLFNYPMVLKIPDGSFSIGVKKVNDRSELKIFLSDYLKKSSLILVQKFLPTDFDWRIGVLDNKPLFACRYYMSRGHWQIYNHEDMNGETYGESDTVDLSEVPPKILKSALKVTSLIGNGLYGVDLKEFKGNPMVVEVNDNPNIDAGVEDLVLKKELYKKIAECFLRRGKFTMKPRPYEESGAN